MGEEMRELKKEFAEIWCRDGLASFSNASNFGLEDLRGNLGGFKQHPPGYSQELIKFDSSNAMDKKGTKHEMTNAFTDAMISYNFNPDADDGRIGVDTDIFGTNDHSASKMLSVNQCSTAVPNRSYQHSIKDESDLLDQTLHRDRMVDFANQGGHSPNPFDEDNFHFDEYNENSLSQMWGGSNPIKHEEFGHSFDFERANVKREEIVLNGEFVRPRNTGLKSMSEMTHKLLDSPECTMSMKEHDQPSTAGSVTKEIVKLSIKTAKPRVSEEAPEDFYDAATQDNSRISTSAFDNDDDEKSGKRGSNGLRIISRRVVEIISQRHDTNFVEVAEVLVKEMRSRARNLKPSELAKEEKNLKRRVYDALNVLIASNVIEKSKKRVVLLEKQNGIAQLTRYHNKSNQILHRIKQIKDNRKKKLEQLQELISKNLAIKNIIERNKRAALKSATSSQGESLKSASSQKSKAKREEERYQDLNQTERFKFPLLLLSLAKGVDSNAKSGESLKFVPSEDGTELLISSNKCFQVLGDIDILLKMNMQKVSKDFFIKHLGKSLLTYLPKNFFK